METFIRIFYKTPHCIQTLNFYVIFRFNIILRQSMDNTNFHYYM